LWFNAFIFTLLLKGKEVLLAPSAVGNCGMKKFFVQGISGGLCWKEAWIEVQGSLLNLCKIRSPLGFLLMGCDWLQM